MDGHQNPASKSNKKVQLFGFTKHFPKDFMRPYGETDRPHMGTTADVNRKAFCCTVPRFVDVLINKWTQQYMKRSPDKHHFSMVQLDCLCVTSAGI